MPFEEFISDAHFYAFIGSAGSTIPVRALRPENKNQEQQQDLASQEPELPEQNNSEESPNG
jgi:hypothetical protein